MMLSDDNYVKTEKVGVRKSSASTDLAASLFYFSMVLLFSVLVSYAILSLTRGPYIGYRVPYYLIVLALATFLSTLVFIVAAVIKYTRRIIYALIFSLLSVTVSFYLYEYYIVLSRHLSVMLLPCMLLLSNGTHTTYVVDLGQIALIIAVLLAYALRKHGRGIGSASQDRCE